jgi:hypothetical protein
VTTHRLARIWKQGRRWHWSLVVCYHSDAPHAHIYQGDAPSWREALADFKFADFVHGAELDNRV